MRIKCHEGTTGLELSNVSYQEMEWHRFRNILYHIFYNRNVIRYAAERVVSVMPEFDTPGLEVCLSTKHDMQMFHKSQ